MKTIHQPAELYAHAIAIEREAAERYGEFAERMGDLGNDAAAEVFGRLAALEAEHLDALLRRTDGVALPKLSTDQYRWLDAEPPETAAHELVFRLLTPRQALAIALGAEKRAQAFFEHIFMTTDDPSLRGLAQEMAMEGQEHVGMVERMLERTPDPSIDWQAALQASRRA